MRVLLMRLEGMALPEPLQPVLAHATRHWEGYPQNWLGLNEEVWGFINTVGPRGTDLGKPEGRPARALLCVLQPDGDEEARSMTADWFAAMADEQPGEGR